MSNAFIRTALIQHCDQGDVRSNLEYIADETATAAAQGANLVLLQELHNHAYFCQTEDHCHFDLAESIPGPSTEALGKVAKDHGIVIRDGVVEKLFYPVFPPDRNAEQVVAWLREQEPRSIDVL